ncbi:hypothetical protein MPDQ_006797 [Monascus purpureus]|uniref:Uncharacterized protein n=1 Tax=Monascus purpureus TaxID=5098 RepID=A0A507QVS0_MONPU|nr:hypothetical protein MPDQ_006797 [Monascus purpureus]BDD57752.1 hypothetical protein MAP00_003096 [Monascus purpureus]
MKVSRTSQHTTAHHKPSSIMRSDPSNLYTPAMSQSKQPAASPSSRSRPQNPSKATPSFPLGSLPRFHPTVYQSPNASHNSGSQPSSSQQARNHSYRHSSGSRDALRQYRELVESVALSRTPSGSLSPGPSAPRLGPLRSPGPVTPLTLEEPSSYLAAAGAVTQSDHWACQQHYGPPQDRVMEKLVVRESERARQDRKSSMGL